MKIVFSAAALDKINDIAEFIDDINTEGAGDSWAERLFQFIAEYANLPNITWALCNHPQLAERGYSCTTYNRVWVIVFKVEDNTFKVYDLVNGALLY